MLAGRRWNSGISFLIVRQSVHPIAICQRRDRGGIVFAGMIPQRLTTVLAQVIYSRFSNSVRASIRAD
jgi:hypothetical protein